MPLTLDSSINTWKLISTGESRVSVSHWITVSPSLARSREGPTKVTLVAESVIQIIKVRKKRKILGESDHITDVIC